MNNSSRLENSTRNFFVGILQQCLILFLGFFSRLIFIKYLGVEYLGINGLFSNILMVLSMADLGFGTAIVYSMYKPLSENDEKKISALLYFYKRIYNIIAAVVTLIGVSLVPFLSYLVKLDNPIQYLEVYYLLFLANTVISYLFSYKMCIIIADQKNYLLNVYSSIFQILQFILQIIILLIFRNYIIYILVQIICTLMNNLFSTYKASKLYPYIGIKSELSREEKKSIWMNIKSMFIYKIGGVLLNNTDNIIISTMLGTIWVGYYSNYSMVVTYISTFTSLIFSSLSSSIGNLSVTTDKHYQYQVFKKINTLSNLIYGFCSICLIVLLSDFIEIVYGVNYRLDFCILLITVFNFYIPGLIRPTSLYRDATGLFNQTKYVFLVTCLINLILSVLLGKLYGLFGIFLATLIARLLTNFWFEPYMLYKKYFNRKIYEYIKVDILYIGVFFVSLCATYVFANIFRQVSISIFIYKMFICCTIPIICNFVLLRKNKEFLDIGYLIKHRVLYMFKKILIKKEGNNE